MKNKIEKCAFCGTDEDLTKHHLVTKEWRKKLAMLKCERMILCWMCHRQVHRIATNKELSFIFNTKFRVIELLKGNKIDVIKEYESNKIISNGIIIEIKKVRSREMNHKEYALF